jgi:hypothetical protein
VHTVLADIKSCPYWAEKMCDLGVAGMLVVDVWFYFKLYDIFKECRL